MAAGRSASTSSSSDAVTPQTDCVYRCCCWRGPVVTACIHVELMFVLNSRAWLLAFTFCACFIYFLLNTPICRYCALPLRRVWNDPQCQMLTELRGSQCTLSSELRHCLSWMSSCAGQRWWCYLDEKRLMAIDSCKQSLLHTSVKGPLHPKSHKPLSSNALRWNIMAQCIVFLYHANKVILSKEV